MSSRRGAPVLSRLTFSKQEAVEEEEEPAPQPSKAKAREKEVKELDMNETRHKGQFALRKLYHESPRLVAVIYTSPSCGPCRTLKPIFNKVIDEFPGQVRP